MDAYEATKIVFQRIQTMDPQNAAKVMGLLLIRGHGEKEMIRLAFGPESLVQSVILKAKKELSLASPVPNMSSTSPPPPPPPPPLSPFSSPLSRQNSCPSSVPPSRLNLPSPLSITTSSCPWTNSNNLTDFQDDLISPSGYNCSSSSPSTMNSAAPPFYGRSEIDLIDELQLQDQLSFLNDASSQVGQKSPDFYYPHQQDLALSPTGNPWGGGVPHRRSYSVSDMYLGSDDVSGGFGWKPCLFYARGYCKNGTSCRFLHGEGGGVDCGASVVGSPSKFEMMEQQCQELLRSKPSQQHLVSSANLSYSANKCINLMDTSRALMMGDGMHKFGRGRIGEFGINGVNPGSRQIYLTFPADSTFKEEDVSNYFSNYGPVQDVRIPYQQKRMFGFVTFEYPETVKLILAKGNPHFVCDARVLVKPYKEKGKIPDKHRKQQQQMERGDFTGCGSPTGLDSRDPYEIQLGPRMFYGAQDILWRRKLEGADLQQSIELQNRRLMGLQLLDVKRNGHQCALSNGSVISSPTSFFSLNVMSSNQSSPEAKEENGSFGMLANPSDVHQLPVNLVNVIEKDKGDNKIDKESLPKESESSDHNLPDSPFASQEAAGEYTAFSNATVEAEKGIINAGPDLSTNHSLITGTALFPPSPVDMSPFKSCYFQLPRFASGRETIGMTSP